MSWVSKVVVCMATAWGVSCAGVGNSDDEARAGGTGSVTVSGGRSAGGGSGGVGAAGGTSGGVASTGATGAVVAGGDTAGGARAGGAPVGGAATGGAAAGGGAATGGTSTGGLSTGGVTSGGTRVSGGDGGGGGGEPETGGMATGGTAGSGWELVWADEFEGVTIDATKWEHEVDCWGGGNNEEQCYVADGKNSYVQDGELHIVARHDFPSGPIGGPSEDPTVVERGYSSARLRTLDRGDFRYGRFEARLRLPFGQGLWPAFWMLPSEGAYGGWAASGEIDVVEAVNLAPGANEIHGTLHYGGPWPANVSSGTSFRPSENVWEAFHVYAVEWEEGEIRWFFDGEQYAAQNDWYSEAAGFPAPFDQRFHLLLNVAVGGTWPGPPDETAVFPQEMVVDYVRVYVCSTDSETGHGCGPG